LKRHILCVSVLVMLALAIPLCSAWSQDESIELWPEIEPYSTGYLKVSDLHEIYYEQCGSPAGKPVFVLHGGPGAGCYPYYRRFFNPKRFNIVLHDQRGCGKSKPAAETRENTTQNLVEDIERLRKRLGLGRIILFGGSWGSTLALAYAETYPDNVSGMVLRGIFLATEDEIDHYYRGGVRYFFPEVYEEFEDALADQGKEASPQALIELIQSDVPEIRKKFSIAWVKYESDIASIEATKNNIESLWKTSEIWRNLIVNMGVLENYYMANDCFLEEGQLLDNADRIRDIPVTIVNGRYDMICPPVAAYRLHGELPGSKLVIAEMAGHSQNQKPIERALLEAMREFE